MLKSLSLKPADLERKLGVRFKDRELLDQALVHPSFLNEVRPGEPSPASYERLEFLGDAVLSVAVTLELFTRCPGLPEGQLTKLRSSLVKGATLAKVAAKLGLGPYLKLGKGEESTGGRERESNLADAFEALVGAAFLDRGFQKARDLVLRTMQDEIDELLVSGTPEDPKSRLQELVQSAGGAPPRYRVVEEAGSGHDRDFDVEVITEGRVLGRGQGKRKAEAEKQAAARALRWMATSGDSSLPVAGVSAKDAGTTQQKPRKE